MTDKAQVDTSSANVEQFIADSLEMGFDDSEGFALLRTIAAERDRLQEEAKEVDRLIGAKYFYLKESRSACLRVLSQLIDEVAITRKAGKSKESP